MFAVERLDGPVEIVETEPPPPGSDAVLARIDAIWAAETARRGEHVFNGSLFTLTRRESGRLTGWFTEYRHWIAQLREPALVSTLGIHPVGVCGLLRFGDDVLLGKRASVLTQFPGLWELAPCGSLEDRARDGRGRPSPEVQLLTELEEELGVPPAFVRSTRPAAIVEDAEAGVTDLVYELDLDCSYAELRAHFERREDEELTEIRLTPNAKLMGPLGASDVSPFAIAALGSLGGGAPGRVRTLY